MKTPEFVTKYFSEDSLQYIESGSFKFGTLQEYSSCENAIIGTRMGDFTEGKHEIKVKMPSTGNIGRIEVPGLIFEDNFVDLESCSPRGRQYAFEYTIATNDWIFCSSIGPYDRDHHRSMRFGLNDNQTGTYLGNPDLTHWVVLDVALFLNAVRLAAKEHPLYSGCDKQFLFHNDVSYNKYDEIIPYRENIKIHEEDLIARVTNTVLSKPAFFAVEKEYRFILSLKAPYCADFNDPAAILTSDLLQKSIVEIGEM